MADRHLEHRPNADHVSRVLRVGIMPWFGSLSGLGSRRQDLRQSAKNPRERCRGKAAEMANETFTVHGGVTCALPFPFGFIEAGWCRWIEQLFAALRMQLACSFRPSCSRRRLARLVRPTSESLSTRESSQVTVKRSER